MRVILTSTGLENRVIKKQFKDMIDKEPEELKALFIPIAAIEPGAKGSTFQHVLNILNRLNIFYI